MNSSQPYGHSLEGKKALELVKVISHALKWGSEKILSSFFSFNLLSTCAKVDEKNEIAKKEMRWQIIWNAAEKKRKQFKSTTFNLNYQWPCSFVCSVWKDSMDAVRQVYSGLIDRGRFYNIPVARCSLFEDCHYLFDSDLAHFLCVCMLMDQWTCRYIDFRPFSWKVTF